MMQFSITVLMATVFPPVLGPVITIPRSFSPTSNCNGTAISLSIKGCRAWLNFMRRSVLITGSTPSISRLNLPLENIKSNFSIMVKSACNTGADAKTKADSVYKMRYISFSSLILSSCSSSAYFATLAGSIKSVLPVADLSITLPDILSL